MTLRYTPKTFATLLRNSKFITQGDFRGAIMAGKVFHVTNDDLYVDLGMKFHAIVKKPQQDNKLYVRGSMVKLKLLDYEITDRFLGSDKDISLLEADAILLGLESTPLASLNEMKMSSRDSKDMEYDTKNKHRISDARWRDSVSRCYNLLKQCAYAEQESTRMAILRLTVKQIESFEGQIKDMGLLDQVKSVFAQGEAASVEQQLQQQQVE